MWNCPHCHASVPESAQTCGACGREIQQIAAVTGANVATETVIPAVLPVGSSRKWLVVLIVVTMALGITGSLMYAGIEQAREASRRTTARCRLKQLGLAAHNFNDQFHHFPPWNLPTLTRDSSIPIDGRAVPQAFFTDILPFIDQQALNNQRRYDLPWTHADNKAVFATIVSTYQHPSVPVAPHNEDGYALAHYATNSKVICDTKTVKLSEITDGTSNTMVLGTVNAGFQAWGDPTNYRNPSKGFGGGPEAFGAIGRETGVQILLFDGSVRSVPVKTQPEIIEKLGDPRDGQNLCDVF